MKIDYGDWGLGIGDWAQSPIPNPQSPNYEFILFKHQLSYYLISIKRGLINCNNK